MDPENVWKHNEVNGLRHHLKTLALKTKAVKDDAAEYILSNMPD
jgi:hypothetical protein